MRPFILRALVAFLVAPAHARASEPAVVAAPRAIAAGAVAWQPWSDDIFARAKREKRLVILDLEAVWCHWCHVMDEKTYGDPAVAALLGKRYLAVRVDQDARPDISSRYQDYGWPATIIFDSNGRELALRSGYIQPGPMEAMLRAFDEDPTPGPSALSAKLKPWSGGATAARGVVTPALRKELQGLFVAQYDALHDSWGDSHKFLEWNGVEYALARARAGDADAERMARRTLAAQKALFDPAWGGVYQYSAGGDWNEPHFEKLISIQAWNLKLYARAYALWREKEHLAAANEILRYLRAFLKSPEGAFYVSQDADLVAGEHSAGYFALGDAERRALGVPRVDTHVYSRENGWVVEALVALHEASGEDDVLREAVTAAEWIVAHRSLPGGGFRHDELDPAGPYLGDSASMGGAFLSLYKATGDDRWLKRAEGVARFIEARFRVPNGAGFATSARRPTERLAPRPNRDENLAVARFAHLLFGYSAAAADRAMAAHAMGFAAMRSVALEWPAAAVLLADDELSRPPA